MTKEPINCAMGIAGTCLGLALLAGCAAEPKSFEMYDVFLAHAPTFEPSRFGMAVRDPMAGQGGLFLWYPSVLPEEGTFSGWVKPDAALGCGPLFSHIETDAAYRGKPEYGLQAEPDWRGLAFYDRRPGQPATDAD